MSKTLEREEFYIVKKIISFLFVICFVFSIATVSAATYSDMPNDWSTVALQHAVDNGLLTGSNGKLLPKDNLTRAQMATIIVRALGASEAGDISSFTDVDSKAWYYNSMAIAYKLQLFRGDGAGKLNPNSPITRQEAFVVLGRAFSLSAKSNTGLSRFVDKDDVASWAKENLEAMILNGYVSGSGPDGNKKLNPLANISRAEFSQVMYNLVKFYVDDASDIPASKVFSGNVIVRSKSLSLLDAVTVNGDIIIADGVNSGFSLNNSKVTGRIIVRADGVINFDGNANEMIVVPSNTTVNASKNSTILNISIVDNKTSAVQIKSDSTGSTGSTETTPTVPVIPDNPSTPTTPNEDIWTSWQ